MTAAMPYPKTQFCMTGINETVATAIGGFSRTTGQVVEKTTHFYNLLSSTWTAGPSLLAERNLPGKKI